MSLPRSAVRSLGPLLRRPRPHALAGLACARAPPARTAAAASQVESVDVPGDYPLRKPLPQREPPQKLRDLNVGFIGWGAMAQAVSLGLMRKDLLAPEGLRATDVVPEIHKVAEKHGVKMAASNKELVKWADVIVVAVKPQVVDSVISEIQPLWGQGKLLVSICAGVTIGSYLGGLGEAAKVVRVMPNTPCLVGQAATAYAGSPSCEEWELELVHKMFGAVGGATHRVPEYLLNAVTGLSGSGPAYVYMMIQALSDAGVHGGLPRSVSLSLAAQTVAGAARMVQAGGHPAVLKESVTSPAGTTIAGVRVLEQKGFNSAIIEAVEAARARSEELSKTPDFLFEGKRKGSNGSSR